MDDSSQEPARKIPYSLNRADLICAHISRLVRNRIFIGFMLVLALAPLWQVVQLLGDKAFQRFSLPVRILAGCFLMGVYFAFLLSVQAVFLLVSNLASKRRGILGEHELEITEQGLVERTDVNETLHKWVGFDKTVVGRRLMFICVTESMWHAVPKRCFQSPEELEQFRSEINARGKLAQGAKV